MNKKAQEIFPLLMLIGIIAGFTVYFGYSIRDYRANLDNPFYGRLGARELHILGMYNRIEGDLFVLDMLGKYAFYDSIIESANNFHLVDNSDCGFYFGSNIINNNVELCINNHNMLDVSENLRRSINSNLYSKILSSGLYFPMKYDYHFIQNEESFILSAYSHNTLRFAIDVSKFSDRSYRPSPRPDSETLIFDISNECIYLGPNQRAKSDDTTRRYTCKDNYCIGPCPDGINLRIVPYFNQCNIPQCNFGHCGINYEIICSEGCGFKSSQMAFSYYGFFFDELRSRNTNNVLTLLDEMRSDMPNSILESEERRVHEDEECSNIVFPISGAQHSLCIAREITDENYDKIIELLETGLVRLKLSHHGKNMFSARSELGYPINLQHYVLAIAGNERYLIIHDPLTPGRNFRTGINVVLSRNFVKESWTGHYRHITGENLG